MSEAKPEAPPALEAPPTPRLRIVEEHAPQEGWERTEQTEPSPGAAPGVDSESRVAGTAAVPRRAVDVSHFERIVAQVRTDLYRYAFWLSRDASLAEDLVQEALVRAWRFLPSLRDGAAVKQWLITIVRREFARTFERKRLRAVDIDEINFIEEGLAIDPPDPDVATLRRAILELEPEYREPLVLHALFGYSTAEIGRMMGITQGATLTRLFRARKKLATALEAAE